MAARGNVQNNSSEPTGGFQPVSPLTPKAMPGSSVPLQMGHTGDIPSVNTKGETDSRDEAPKDWDEVRLLRDALQPSIRSFTRVTSRPPPAISGSSWLSYNGQLEILQRESDRCWGVDRRAGLPPKLAKLAEWGGGIRMVGKAVLRITEAMTEKSSNKNICESSYGEGSIGWHQDTFGEQAYKETEKILSAADAREEKLEAQSIDGEKQKNVCEALTETLDMFVAQDPERYLAWLLTMGYHCFTKTEHNPCKLGWVDWCRYEAPVSFVKTCKQDATVARPPTGPGAISRTKYGPPCDRPTITLEEAKRGNKRVMESHDVAGGKAFSSKEEAQYYMMGGQATSRAAAAHSHFLRGKDGWLFELGNSSEEEPKDPSRRREAEVEASFVASRADKS